jgi:hypothetical protein
LSSICTFTFKLLFYSSTVRIEKTASSEKGEKAAKAKQAAGEDIMPFFAVSSNLLGIEFVYSKKGLGLVHRYRAFSNCLLSY